MANSSMPNLPPSIMTQSSASAYSTSKRQKHSDEEGKVDKTLDIPDSILCDILSRIPTKDAVATSVLSTRWRYLWTFLPVIDLDDEDHVGFSNFVLLVYRVLVLRNHASCIKKFRLNCSKSYDSNHFNAWVYGAMARGVEELDLSLGSRQRMELFRPVFECKTLVSLKLSHGIVLNVPLSVHFPNLKFLHLNGVEYRNIDSLERLITGCPILEDLSMVGFRFDRGGIFNICAPALKILAIDYMIDHPEFSFSIENLSSLVEANVNVRGAEEHDEEYNGNSAFQILTGLYNVKFLSLSGYTMECQAKKFCTLLRSPPPLDDGLTLEHVSSDELPVFHNLTILEMDCDWHLLPNFLESSPNLEVVSLKKFVFRGEGHAFWRQPQSVPECLTSHLTTVDIGGFKGSEDEVKCVGYILENAEVLKTMTIQSCGLNNKGKLRVLRKLSMFPRGSKTCQLAFF